MLDVVYHTSSSFQGIVTTPASAKKGKKAKVELKSETKAAGKKAKNKKTNATATTTAAAVVQTPAKAAGKKAKKAKKAGKSEKPADTTPKTPKDLDFEMDKCTILDTHKNLLIHINVSD
jgi:hypothetical protein